MCKVIQYILVLISAVSCKSFTDFSNQKVSLNVNKSQKFDLTNNQIIIPLKVNNCDGKFVFDTGAMSSVITNNDFIKLFTLTNENYYTAVKVKGATGDYIKSNHLISDSISSNIISGRKKIFKHLIIESKKTNCFQNEQNQTGIIGFDIFKNAAQPILLDFENNNITVLGNNYITEGYSKLPTKINIGLGNKLTIPFLIEGVEVNFLFDTGNNGGFLMSEKQNKITDDKKIAGYESLIGTVGNFSLVKIKTYGNVSVKNDSISEIKTNVSVFPELITNTVGISFIKQFNWILDFGTGSVYIKQLSEFKNEDLSSEIENTKFKSIALENKLIIGFKNLSIKSTLNAGDEITAVNNQKVTPENICEMQDLLNKNEDWSTLELEVVPKTN